MKETHHVPMPPVMPKAVGRLLDIAWFVVPAGLAASFGLQIGNEYTAIAAVIFWFNVFFALNYAEIEDMSYVVINCLGRHRTVKFGGPCFILRGLHRILRLGDLRMHSMELFVGADGKRTDMDFQDGSAPIAAKAWWQAASPEAVARRDWKTVRDQIVRFVYRLSEEERLTFTQEVFQSVLRSVLEPNSMRGAQDNAMNLTREATEIIRGILEEVGVFPASATSITLSGLALTEEQRRMRQEGMRGKAEADRAINQAPAYIEPLVAMLKRCQELGLDLNDSTRTFLTQKLIEALPELKGSINLVGNDFGRIIGMLQLGNAAAAGPAPGGSP